ncbi:hypothetical protein [Streptococcus thoraltensis]
MAENGKGHDFEQLASDLEKDQTKRQIGALLFPYRYLLAMLLLAVMIGSGYLAYQSWLRRDYSPKELKAYVSSLKAKSIFDYRFDWTVSDVERLVYTKDGHLGTSLKEVLKEHGKPSDVTIDDRASDRDGILVIYDKDAFTDKHSRTDIALFFSRVNGVYHLDDQITRLPHPNYPEAGARGSKHVMTHQDYLALRAEDSSKSMKGVSVDDVYQSLGKPSWSRFMPSRYGDSIVFHYPFEGGQKNISLNFKKAKDSVYRLEYKTIQPVEKKN